MRLPEGGLFAETFPDRTGNQLQVELPTNQVPGVGGDQTLTTVT